MLLRLRLRLLEPQPHLFLRTLFYLPIFRTYAIDGLWVCGYGVFGLFVFACLPYPVLHSIRGDDEGPVGHGERQVMVSQEASGPQHGGQLEPEGPVLDLDGPYVIVLSQVEALGAFGLGGGHQGDVEDYGVGSFGNGPVEAFAKGHDATGRLEDVMRVVGVVRVVAVVCGRNLLALPALGTLQQDCDLRIHQSDGPSLLVGPDPGP
mmetsp:Transcript_37942/g.88289  ORF Transcript_37942/g.88289 Transcript_37942/m.88289 type:complete len:206 (+) Transcript_37942:90-707(+)